MVTVVLIIVIIGFVIVSDFSGISLDSRMTNLLYNGVRTQSTPVKPETTVSQKNSTIAKTNSKGVDEFGDIDSSDVSNDEVMKIIDALYNKEK